jgi:hypothetical protein
VEETDMSSNEGTEEDDLHEPLELTRVMFEAGNKTSPKTKLHHNLKGRFQRGGRGTSEERKNMYTVQIFRSVISFVDSNPQYNKYYLMLREMRQDAIKERHKR